MSSKNILRSIRNQVNAQIRQREQDLKRMQEYIRSAFVDEQEKADFWMNAFSCWGQPNKASEVFEWLKKHEHYLDRNLRGVITLSQLDALELGGLIAEWNREWDYAVTHDMSDYNTFSINFSIASGTENIISVPTGNYRSDIWQQQ